MRYAAIFVTATVLLSGCATEEIYSRPDLDQALLQRDYAECVMYSQGAPQQHTPVNSYTATTTTYGNTSTTTIAPNPYAQAGAALGDAFANAERQTELRRLCMQARGYTYVRTQFKQ